MNQIVASLRWVKHLQPMIARALTVDLLGATVVEEL